MWILFWSFVVSLLLSYLSIVVFSRLFYKFWILDNPEKYWKTRKPVPYSMWIVFFLVFFTVSSLVIEFNYKLWLIWLFWALITWASYIDDRLHVSAKYRLLLQIIIWGIIALTSIKIWYVSSIFGWVIDLEVFSLDLFGYVFYVVPFLFTILWYVFVFNALNWTDGISWNTSGLSIISFSVLFLLGYILFLNDTYQWGVDNALFIMKLCIILVWILLPFWFFDVREKILMWDSGTMFLGFMLATMAIIAGWKIATVLVVFGIYSVDAIYVIMRRMYAKKNPLKWDFTHLHHRLSNAWLSKVQFLSLVYSLSFFFGVTALFLDKNGKIIVFWLIVFVVIFINKVVEGLSKKQNNN